VSHSETDLRSRESRKIYPGWWIVLVSGILSGLSSGFYTYGISVFFKDIAAELGLSRAVTSFAAGIGRLEGGITAPVTGWLADKFGPRWVVFSGVCLVTVGLGLMYFITSAWQYFIVWGLLAGTGINLGFAVAIDKTITNWFVRKRGLALGIKFGLIGVGAVVVLPVISWLVIGLGWRITCVIWSLVMLASAPLMYIFIKQRRPEYYGLLPDGAKSTEVASSRQDVVAAGLEYASSVHENEFTFKQAVKTRTYWIVGMAYGAFALVTSGINIHIIPFLTDRGINSVVASGMMSMMILFTIPSRFLGGVVADRVAKRYLQYLLAGVFGLLALGLGIFLFHPDTVTVYALLILYGLSTGSVSPLIILIIGRFFGRKAFGSIFGSCMLFQGPLALLAPVYAGWVYDTSNSYVTAFMVFGIIATIATLVICLAKAPDVPGTVSANDKEALAKTG
jgi:cyanate permease